MTNLKVGKISRINQTLMAKNNFNIYEFIHSQVLVQITNWDLLKSFCNLIAQVIPKLGWVAIIYQDTYEKIEQMMQDNSLHIYILDGTIGICNPNKEPCRGLEKIAKVITWGGEQN